MGSMLFRIHIFLFSNIGFDFSKQNVIFDDVCYFLDMIITEVDDDEVLVAKSKVRI